MAFRRIHSRELPDGSVATVYPFHISMEGMESVLLCRDDEDYDALQKCIYVSCWDNNVIIVSDIEMSNHGHFIVLAHSLSQAEKAAYAVKQRHSQYLANKYKEHNVLSRSDVKVIYLDSDWYLRNALAYVPRNALDTGSSIDGYKWSSYRAMFSTGLPDGPCYKVSMLTRREKEAIFRTHADLGRVPWMVDKSGLLIPETACEHRYAEKAFMNDQAFFLKTVGSVNCAEMELKLVTNPRKRMSDGDMRNTVREIAQRWFNTEIIDLSPEMKTRLVPYLYRSHNTSVAQLARCVGLSQEQVKDYIRR
ncbi:MAG: hypothetical protein J5759_03195 [Bacteroidales bacterium]|nr:hypothetical protein [Bacteroidales bacterium]